MIATLISKNTIALGFKPNTTRKHLTVSAFIEIEKPSKNGLAVKFFCLNSKTVSFHLKTCSSLVRVGKTCNESKVILSRSPSRSFRRIFISDICDISSYITRARYYDAKYSLVFKCTGPLFMFSWSKTFAVKDLQFTPLCLQYQPTDSRG